VGLGAHFFGTRKFRQQSKSKGITEANRETALSPLWPRYPFFQRAAARILLRQAVEPTGVTKEWRAQLRTALIGKIPREWG